MKIGIIGAGNVGTGLGKRLAANGHDLLLSFSRDLDKLRLAAQAIGARVGSPDEAATHGEVVILATPWVTTLDVVRATAPSLVGKILWDTTNPLKVDMSGLEIGTTTSAGEQVAAAAPGAIVVKAVPPFAELLRRASLMVDGSKPGVFVCSDDEGARQTVLSLVAVVGADGVAAGALKNARYAEPLGMLLVQLAYVQGMGAEIGASLLRDTRA